jgi:hypothetical protein
MMSQEMSEVPSDLSSSLAVGEPRVFEARLWTAELQTGTTLTTLVTDDIEIRNVVFIFDLNGAGKQFPEMALIVKANKKLECPSGRLDFYDKDTTLVGGGDLRDLAPKEKVCLSIAVSRKIQAHVKQEFKDEDGPEQTIHRRFTVTLTLKNTTPHKLTIGYSLPRNGRLLSDLLPEPEEEKPNGCLWFRVVDTEEVFVLNYTETIDRK